MDKKDETTVSDLRMIVYGDPVVKTIIPKYGDSKGKEVSLLSFRAFHPVTKEDSNGDKTHDSTWYTVDCFQESALYLKEHLKDGMVLHVSGVLKEHKYKGKDGDEREALSVTAYKLNLDLLQKGLSAFAFNRPTKHKDMVNA